MSPPSPAAVEGVVALEVKADGTLIDSGFQVVSIDTWSAVNKIPKARITLYDGSPAEQDFPISNTGTFLPGTDIVIAAGYENKTETIFSGIIVSHRIEIARNGSARLIVEVADKAIKMTVSRNTASFEQVADNTLIQQLISNAGLSSDVQSTTETHEAVVQYDATDWDMLVARAEMNGLVVTVEAGKVTVKPPDTSQAPVLQVTYGESIIDMIAELDAVSQLPQSAITGYSWDSEKQQAIETTAAGKAFKEAGNVTSQTLAGVLNVATFPRLTGGLVQQADLQAWTDGQLLRSKLAKIRGMVRFQGSALVKPGTVIELAGVGQRFNGSVFVSAVHHEIARGHWVTTVEIGLAAESFVEKSFLNGGAAGHLPAVKGLQTGVVKKVAADPAGGYRVQVSLPIAKNGKPIWARLASFYASNKVGAVFYPEVGDEVVVAFMNEDPRFPIVLGSVYGKKFSPADSCTPAEQNNLKGIVTRSKMEVTFNDEDKIVTIKTPGSRVITLDDKAGEVTIVDGNKNSVKLDSNGITLDSASKIEIKAKSDINLTATGNLALKATGNVTCQGLQVSVKAQSALSAEGTASTELKSSGMLTVQGSLVKIN